MANVTLVPLASQPTGKAAVVSYNELLKHPELYYAGIDLVWVTTASCLVFVMIPALSLIYSGLSNRSFALTLFRLPMITGACVGMQWVLWGYLVTFSDSALSSNWWGGQASAGGYKSVLGMPISVGDGTNTDAVVPELLFALYEGMFASFTAAVVCGGTMQRARPQRFIIFITLWSLLVYDPVARWSWSKNGWLKVLGTLDFAGGTPVHIVSGTTVAAFAIFCSIESNKGPSEFYRAAANRVISRAKEAFYNVRCIVDIAYGLLTFGRHALEDKEPPMNIEQPLFKKAAASFPYNVNFVVLGTSLLWFGWAGFNGGSALGGNLRAVSAWTSTHVAACAGGTTGVLWIWAAKGIQSLAEQNPSMDSEYRDSSLDHGGAQPEFSRLSVWSFCDGAISGLIAITPAAGYVPVWSAAIFGVVGAIGVNFLKQEAAFFLRNDPFHIFAMHSGGGVIGMVLTGIFADPTTTGLDGHSTLPNPDYTMAKRVGLQLADVACGGVYTFVMTLGILYFLKAVAVLLRITKWDTSCVDIPGDMFQAVLQQQWEGHIDPETGALKPKEKPAQATGSYWPS
ncbi:ammonium transporter AmtB-like domain-containing protein [Podospora didyma]|uniref:Ammonium transporter AmtB-like domain-containing protein n=1 Tax=Podospora didyma TaxID=330526 RepID=A0AAE0JZ93_9PEZI|nr:ammonium transporter AmtB-like domain-containing protein [Podospora didyma]